MKYRKRSVVIDAIQLTTGNLKDVETFLAGREMPPIYERNPSTPWEINWGNSTVAIRTLEGTMTAQPGDYIIRGIKGELYPVKPEIFEELHDAETGVAAKEADREPYVSWGNTEICGLLELIDGRPVLTRGQDERITIEATADQIEEMRPRFGTRVVVCGVAWRGESKTGCVRDIVRFRFCALGMYDGSTAAEAFAALREVAGVRWSNIDPDEFMREQRGEDDDEQASDGWLLDQGFRWSTDGESVEIGNDLQVICTVNTNSRSDDFGMAKSISLHWSYPLSTPKVSMHYVIDDNPTCGQVSRLCEALGIALATEAKS